MDDPMSVFKVFWRCLFGCILGIFIVCCAANSYNWSIRSSKNDPELACIEAKGNWGRNVDSSTYVCRFPDGK